MKAAIILFVVMFVVISPLSAQTADTKSAVKPSWGRIYNQADFDTLTAKFKAFPDSDAVILTWGELRQLLGFNHDQTLRDGDKRFVNMPGMYKRQVTKVIAARFDTVNTTVNTAITKADAAMETATMVTSDLAKTDSALDDLAYFTKGLDQSVANLQLVAIGDKTPVPIPPEIKAVVRTEDATMEAGEVAMELIKQEVVARRAVAAKMTPFNK